MEERPSQYCYIEYMKSTPSAIACTYSCLALGVEQWEVAVFTVACISVRSRLCFWVIDVEYSRFALSRNEKQKCKPFNTERLESGK